MLENPDDLGGDQEGTVQAAERSGEAERPKFDLLGNYTLNELKEYVLKNGVDPLNLEKIDSNKKALNNLATKLLELYREVMSAQENESKGAKAIEKAHIIQLANTLSAVDSNGLLSKGNTKGLKGMVAAESVEVVGGLVFRKPAAGRSGLPTEINGGATSGWVVSNWPSDRHQNPPSPPHCKGFPAQAAFLSATSVNPVNRTAGRVTGRSSSTPTRRGS